MAVIGTKAEYFTSVWVKNEWGRFLKLMEKNPEKQMFFACDDPEEMPRAFASKQAQILGEDGAIQNLAVNIDNYLKNSKKTEAIRPEKNVYQQEFDEILEAKTREYVKDFRNSELGRERKEILDIIDKYVALVDTYNDKDRLTFAVGTITYLSAYMLMLMLLFFFDRIGFGFRDIYIWSTLLPLPLIIAGTAILLSYNWILDVITISFMMAVLIISAFLRNPPFTFLPFLAVYAPAAVYILTGLLLDNFNRFKVERKKAGLEIKKELEGLKRISDSAGAELTTDATKLLKEYKERNKISIFLKLNDDDYFKALENFNYMYESAEKKYMKYVDVSDPKAVWSSQKEESRFGTTSLASFLIIPFTVFSHVVAALDIALDKYKECRHRYSYWTLGLYLVVFVGLLVGFMCVMGW